MPNFYVNRSVQYNKILKEETGAKVRDFPVAVKFCSSYECFILRARRLSSKLLKEEYLVERLKSSFRKFRVNFQPIRLSTNFQTSLGTSLLLHDRA